MIENKNKAEELLKVSLTMINQALNTERPEVALNICKSMTKMCKRLLLDSHESYFLLGLCHFKMVINSFYNTMGNYSNGTSKLMWSSASPSDASLVRSPYCSRERALAAARFAQV